MLPKLLLPAVISVFLLTTTTSAITKTTTRKTASATSSAAASTSVAVSKPIVGGETTTSLLPLQPPLNVTSTTTSSFVPAQPKHSITGADNVAVKSDSLLSDSANTRREYQMDEQTAGNYQAQLSGGNSQSQVDYNPIVRYDNKFNHSSVRGHFAAKQGKAEPKLPANSQGYIHFDLNYDDEAAVEEKVQKRKSKKTETVNEVLSSLFPNGFSDIFRFSYAAEPATETPAMSSSTTYMPKTKLSTSTIQSTTLLPQNQTFYSYQTSVSKEYRRETRPGHTEIVVEKIERAPKSSSEEFKDGSNLITKDDLLRINRAAVDASVLPSLLIKPANENATAEETLLSANGPIVILNDNSDELEETVEDDNQIAESQQVGHIYQRLPETIQVYPYKDDNDNYKSNAHVQGQKQEINVQIIHDERLKEAAADAGKYSQKLFTPAAELQAEKRALPLADNIYPREQRGSHELDHFQEHAEKNFKQRNLLQEAPSRKFLKHFNPVLTEGDNGPISKGNFHYEANTPRPIDDYAHFNPVLTEGDNGPISKGNFHYEANTPRPIDDYAHVRPAAQLEYQFEQQQQQVKQLQQQQHQQHEQQQHQQHQQQQQQHQQHEQQQFQQPQEHDISQYHQEQQQQEHQQQEQQQQEHQQQEHQQQEHQQPQQQQIQQPQQTRVNSELHTHIQHSQAVTATPQYQDYQSTLAVHQHDTVTPSGLVFVTVNPPKSQPEFTETASQLSTPSKHSKSPHEYVSEAAAALQQHSQLQTEALHEYEAHASQIQEQIDEVANESQPQQKENHEYQAEATAAASQTQPQHEPPPESRSKPNAGYTYVEVQKSINIHNKLITEKDGQLVEQHETIYPHPNYGERLHPLVVQQQQQQPETQSDFSPKEYVSLSANPINVQHIDYESEHQAEASSQDELHHVLPLPPPPPINEPQLQQPQQQHEIHIYEKLVPQPYPVEVEKIVERAYPVTHLVEKKVPEPYPVKEVVEKIVDRPVTVEKIIDRPVKVPYPVHVDHYIDRPYPVQEIVEKHVHVPYPVPEPVPVHVDHFYERPYPVETIVEKPVPYPVEMVVEKIVEKHVPVEVERIVEKPVDRFVEKFIDRPIGVPIQVPVALPMPMLYGPHASHSFPPNSHGHPNALSSWNQPGSALSQTTIPAKVLQNYYARMLKKLLPQMTTLKTHKPSKVTAAARPTAHKSSAKPLKPERSTTAAAAAATQTAKPSFKITDIRFDLKPPPPPPSGASWSQGARYIYNTLPLDLAASAASAPASQAINLYGGSVSSQGNEPYDEFQRWRNGHSLKRSPDFGRNLHVEYGFKPPLVPSLEIDDQGVPLNAGIAKVDE